MELIHQPGTHSLSQLVKLRSTSIELRNEKAAKDKAPGGKGACLKGVLKKPAKSTVT